MKYLTSTFISLFFVITTITAQDGSQKKPMIIYLSYFKQNDALPKLKISTKTKNGRKFEIVEKVSVNVFFKEESSKGFIGSVTTNLWGDAWIDVPKKFSGDLEKMETLTFLATVTQDSIYEDASQEIEISKARIKLELVEQDSTRTIHATLMAWEDSVWSPVPEVEVRLVAKRMLRDIPVTEEEYYETDQDGQVSAEYTNVMPGDEKGLLMIGAKIVDNDLYGNIETTQVINWGTAREADNRFALRTLWSTRNKTPWWLLVFPNLIIMSAWGFIFYLIYLLIKIRNAGLRKIT